MSSTDLSTYPTVSTFLVNNATGFVNYRLPDLNGLSNKKANGLNCPRWAYLEFKSIKTF